MTMSEIWKETSVIETSQNILNSYEHWFGSSLCSREGHLLEQSERLFFLSNVVMCHNKDADPLLCYSNQQALQLFKLDWPTLIKTPSRYTAEPVHRSERAEMLKHVSQFGFIKDYQGIRISNTGKRFHIEKAIVWNVQDQKGDYFGQAVTFGHWKDI